MNFIQTLYVKPGKNLFTDSLGWVAPEYNLMSWALSSLQLHKIYGKVELYCNNEAALVLINEMRLPYQNYYNIYDNLDIPNENLWALPKLFTYSLQKKPFLHVDGDAYIFEKLSLKLMGADLIAQNLEVATSYYLETQNELVNNFEYFPNCVRKDFSSNILIKAVNAGILGGSDIKFFKEYTELAFKYVNDNKRCLDFINSDRFNVFFEQHLFYSLAKEKKIDIDFLIKSSFSDNQYKAFGDFHEVPCKRGYLHLLGQYKKDLHTCRLMAAKLRQLYPEYYHRIIQLFRDKQLPVMSHIYDDKKLNSFSEYQLFASHASEAFNKNPVIGETVITREPLQSVTILQAVIEGITTYTNFKQDDIKNDFAIFITALFEVKEKQSGFESHYLYGRDMDAVYWYCCIFGDDESIRNIMIEQCPTVSIIPSCFDWAGMLNKQQRVGVQHYEQLEILHDEFYNLVVPEVYGDGFSLHDIDEMEKLILDHLTGPMSIEALFIELQAYVEDDIIENHLEEYERMITVMLQQLVLKKAVKPAKNQ